MRLVLGAVVVALVASWPVFGQTPQPTPPMTCEQHLEHAVMANLQLREEYGRMVSQLAATEKQAMALQKQLAAEKAKGAHSEATPK